MADVDAVVELLERWRDAGGMSRVRIGIDATRTIGSLPAARKRALALAVAERVAPQLVPAIEAEDGDLSSEQVGAVIDLLRRADRQQLDQLIGALRGGDVLGAIELVDDAVGAVLPADEGTDELLEDIATEDGEQGADDEDGPPVIDPAAAAALAARDDEVEHAADGTVELDEDAVRARLEAEAAERAERWKDTSTKVRTEPAYRAPALDFGIGDDMLPDPTVDEVAPLEERLHELPGGVVATGAAAAGAAAASTGSGGRAPAVVDTVAREVGRAAPAPRVGPTPAVVARITATPDGYRRRREAVAAIRDGELESVDVPEVVRSLGRVTDRAWVAGAAVDAGLLTAPGLEGLELTAAAIARLAHRAG